MEQRLYIRTQFPHVFPRLANLTREHVNARVEWQIAVTLKQNKLFVLSAIGALMTQTMRHVYENLSFKPVINLLLPLKRRTLTAHISPCAYV